MNNAVLDFLISSVDAAHFMEAAYGMRPDPWQAALLRAEADKIILLCSRQSGKSTVCASMALHKAVFTENSLVLIISNIYRQAEETFRKVKVGLPFIQDGCKIVHETQTMLQLENGSRIISLPGKQEGVRSFSSVSLMIIDEASQVDDDLYRSVRPMLAVSRGQLVALSTPWGKRGWFYNAWANGIDWHRVEITANDCPRITEDFIREEMDEIGEWWVKQEYFCEFVDAEDQVFGHDDLMAAITSKVTAMAA